MRGFKCTLSPIENAVQLSPIWRTYSLLNLGPQKNNSSRNFARIPSYSTIRRPRTANISLELDIAPMVTSAVSVTWMWKTNRTMWQANKSMSCRLSKQKLSVFPKSDQHNLFDLLCVVVVAKSSMISVLSGGRDR